MSTDAPNARLESTPMAPTLVPDPETVREEKVFVVASTSTEPALSLLIFADPIPLVFKLLVAAAATLGKLVELPLLACLSPSTAPCPLPDEFLCGSPIRVVVPAPAPEVEAFRFSALRCAFAILPKPPRIDPYRLRVGTVPALCESSPSPAPPIFALIPSDDKLSCLFPAAALPDAEETVTFLIWTHHSPLKHLSTSLFVVGSISLILSFATSDSRTRVICGRL